MKYRSVIIFFTLLLCTRISFAQYYDTGQDPASLKWRQIKTEHFTVIYPAKYDTGGVAFAKSLDNSYLKLHSLFPGMKFKIPVIIHNYTTHSNGYVSWAPRRMELYPTPEQNTIPLDPVEQLTIHELTHVLQLKSLNKGFSKGMSVLLGEQYYGIAALMLPLWFFEGDAVFAESALTESGRGRTPSFQKELKAITVEKEKLYKYDKIVNGSYRDFIPNYYQTGYQMVTWAMAKYQPGVWNEVLRFTAEAPFTLNPVNIRLAKITGLRKKNLYSETFDSLKTIWTKEVTGGNTKIYSTLNPSKKNSYINYYSPVNTGPGNVIAIKTSLSEPPAFVLINTSKNSEKTIHIPGDIYPWYISYGNGQLVWVETKSDPRWANREYSVIKIMDTGSHKIRSLSRKSRYLSASVSPDGEVIAAVENTVDNVNSLVFMNTNSGIILKHIPSPANAYLQRPQWSEEGGKITMISLTREGEGILSYDFSDQKWETLIAPGRSDLQSSGIRNDSLFFISSFSGTDNIYIRTPDKKIIRLTSSRYGASDLSIAGGKILFSDYTFRGNDVCSVSPPAEAGQITATAYPESFLINRFNIKTDIAENKTSEKYTSIPYRKWGHLFKFHSWMPFYADLEQLKTDPAAIRPGVTLMTQNYLSTLISTIGYEYSSEGNHVFHSHIKWMGRYPVFESQLDYGNFPQILKSGETVSSPTTVNPGVRFLNTVSIPLGFTSGRFSQFLQPSLTADFRNNYIWLKDISRYDNGQYIFTERIYFSNYYRTALRDIYPRWAQVIDLSYAFAPFDKNIYGTSLTMLSTFYFPGIVPGHGLKIRIEKENQEAPLYLYSNRASFPRGYKNIHSDEINFISADYAMPLVYPDFNIASLLYMKRIRTSLFYDFAHNTGNSYYGVNAQELAKLSHIQNFRSFGLELMADFHIFRIPYMISAGVQSAWKTPGEMPVMEFLLNIDLLGMAIGRSRM